MKNIELTLPDGSEFHCKVHSPTINEISVTRVYDVSIRLGYSISHHDDTKGSGGTASVIVRVVEQKVGEMDYNVPAHEVKQLFNFEFANIWHEQAEAVVMAVLEEIQTLGLDTAHYVATHASPGANNLQEIMMKSIAERHAAHEAHMAEMMARMWSKDGKDFVNTNKYLAQDACGNPDCCGGCPA